MQSDRPQSEKQDRTGIYSWRWLLVVRITIVALLLITVYILRLQRLETVPPGLYYDEGANGIDALAVLSGHHALFFPTNTGREGLIIYAIAGLIPFLGQTILALRLPTALAGAGTVLALFWLGQLLFKKSNEANPTTASDRQLSAVALLEQWRGIFIGGTAAGLLAVAMGPTILGRISFRANFVPLFLTLALAHLWLGFTQKNRFQIILAGITTGALAYTYIAARFVPFLLLLWAIGYWVTHRKRGWPAVADIKLAALFAGVTFLIALPMLVDYWLHPEHFFSRSMGISVFDASVNHGAPLKILIQNVLVHFSALILQGDPNWRHNDALQPLLTPIESLLFLLGVIIALLRWRKAEVQLLLLWLIVMILPAALALDATPPNSLRMIGAFPAIYLLVGLGTWSVIQFVIQLYSHSLLLLIAGSILVVGISWKGINTVRNYFNVWALRPQVFEAYRGEWTQVARAINLIPPGAGISYLLPVGYAFGDGYREYNFDYLYQGSTPVHIMQTSVADIAEQIQTLLVQDKASNKTKQVRVVDWTYGRHWDADATDRLTFLLTKYGHFVGSAQFTNYDVHTFDQIDLDPPWQLFDHPEVREIRLDGGISLLWSALGGNSGVQFATDQPIVIPSDPGLWLVLTWRTERVMTANYRLSLRLRNQSGQDVFQTDQNLWGFDRFLTSRWQPNSISESLVNFRLPTNLPTGDYQLLAIVYDDKTLTPTVQEGVWTPEIVLATFQQP